MSETKVALITGSSSGIGEATAKLFSKRGYKVAVAGSNQEKVDRVSAECKELSPQKLQPLSLVLDFNKPENGAKVVRQTIEHFGRLDVLVNNAGIFNICPIDSPNFYQHYREVMTVNLDATVQATVAAVEQLKRTKGVLLFVSSVASTKAHSMSYAYCSSKAAMTMFAKSLALDLAPHVRVNTISPGPVRTPIMNRATSHPIDVASIGAKLPMQRIGESEEIADAIYFLASDSAKFIHGHDLVIDGGYVLK